MARIGVGFLVVLFSAFVFSAPQGDVRIVRYDNNNQGDGNYVYTYELSNGQIHSEAGGLSNADGRPVVVVSGSYAFVGNDGLTYWVNYTADENGFHAVVGVCPHGAIKGGDTASLDPRVFKSLVG